MPPANERNYFAARTAATSRGGPLAQPAARINGNWVVNGRTYGVHPDTGALFPIEGPGFQMLTRGAYKVLGVYNKFGITARAEEDSGRDGENERGDHLRSPC